MKAVKTNRAVISTLILAGLWFINILIVIFGLPFLIVNKIKGLFTGKTDKFAPREEEANSAAYLPRQINSKL
jgi:hypothetical protein